MTSLNIPELIEATVVARQRNRLFIENEKGKQINMDFFEENLDKIDDLVYDNSQIDELSYGGDTMSSKKLLEAALIHTKTTKATAARKIGWHPTQLTNKLARDSIRADEFLQILDEIGVDVILVSRGDGKVIRVRSGRRIRAMVDKVIYDTEKSYPLANSFYADGINEYTLGKASELYVDEEGRYFFAEYSDCEEIKDRIVPVSAAVAAEFIEKFGTDTHKLPKND